MEKKYISFGIYANQTDKRWNTFIEEMNERFDENYSGKDEKTYYGIRRDGVFDNEAITYFEHIITLDDYFAEGSVYRVVPTFKRGERILVWDGKGATKTELIGIAFIEGAEYPVLCVDQCDLDYFTEGKKFCMSSWRYWEYLPAIKENPERQKLQQEIEQLEKELEVKRDKLKDL